MISHVLLIVILATMLVPATTFAQSIFIVNSEGDDVDVSPGNGSCDTGETISGGAAECTLRAALQEANADGAISTINFSIPGEGVHTIMPASPYPDITQAVTIDASTQPGYAGSPLIELDGSNAGGLAVGLTVVGGNSVIRALAINSFGTSGLLLVTGGDNLVVGNYLGTDASGSVARGNGISGLTIIDSSHNTIGGNTPADRNVISGNTEDGVAIFNKSSTDNEVVGNYIGTDATGLGLSAVGNGRNGVLISAVFGETEYASDNIIGRAGPGELNVISGNGQHGIFVFRGARNQLLANIIGLDRVGESALPNSQDGIQIDDGSDNQIGGGATGAGNVISGNGGEGIVIGGALATDNVIEANFIGTDLTGDNRIPNGSNGVLLSSFGAGLPSSGTVIGSIEPGFGNVISGNTKDGVQIGFGSSANTIIGNLIGTKANGQDPLGNLRFGISVYDSDNNTIGGIAEGAENVISGNLSTGVVLTAGGLALGSSNNRVEGNIIGLGADGFRVVGNGQDGIFINQSRDNVIGGSDINSGNTISGNGEIGITVLSPASTSNKIQGNVIGLDQLALVDKPNGDAGVFNRDALDTLIGGALPQEGNIIAGNTLTGVEIDSNVATRTIVQGNYIGTNPAGDSLLGNGSYGVLIKDAKDNEIGGTGEGEGNIIAFNGEMHAQGGHGIVVDGGSGNSIRMNSVFGNEGRGIDLVDKTSVYAFNLPDSGEDADGDSFLDGNEDLNKNKVLDMPDADTGSNRLQNFPLVTDVKFKDGMKTVEWTLYSTPNASFDIDIFANEEADPSGFGEGKRFIKAVQVQTDLHGRVVFEEEFSLESVDGALVGPLVSATATSPQGDTSEFSMIDTDGDAVADQWEKLGIDVDEDGVVDFPFPADNLPLSNHLHKDVFVEIDSMECAVRLQIFPLALACFEPTVDERNALVTAFADVPNQYINNPDGLDGVSLHLKMDETIPYHHWVSPYEGDGREGWPFFNHIKQSGTLVAKGGFGSAIERINFKAIAAKRLIYRYAIFADHFGELDEKSNKQVPYSGGGIAEATRGVKGAIPRAFVDGGNDLFVTLGLWQKPGGTPDQRTGTFMHELGHTLGLMHGGGDHLHRKPNYRSVMNYSWQTPEVNYGDFWKLDYSPVALDPLTETSLDEAKGLGGDRTVVVPVGPPVYKADGTIERRYELEFEGESIDYDRDGQIPVDETGLSVDINNMGYDDFNNDKKFTNLDVRLETLVGNADWSNLRFNFLGTPSLADGVQDEELAKDEITLRLTQDLEAVAYQPGTLGFTVSQMVIDEDAGLVTVTVRRSNGILGTVSVDYETIDLSALASQDYVFTSGTLVFEEDEVYQSFEIEILDDADPEAGEALQVQLSNPQGGADLDVDVFLLGIRPNDGPGELQFLNPFFTTQESAGQATITVVRRGGSTGTVEVDYETADSKALDGEDYTATNGTLTFAEGVTSQTFTVETTEDVLVEGNEGLVLSLSNPTGGAGLGHIDEAYLTILNVPTSGATFDFSEPNYRVGETHNSGKKTVEVIRSKVTDTEVSVDFITIDGSATAGEDYTATSVSLTFLAGEVSKLVDVPILSDSLFEGIEELTIKLVNPSEGAYVGKNGTSKIRILDGWSTTVTNTNDFGEGSLRFAIFMTNQVEGADVIDFDIPGPGPHTIRPLTPFDPIFESLTIDGYTQPGASPNTQEEGSNAVLMIEIDGSDAGPGSGLNIQSSDVAIRGLVINRIPGNLISVSNSSNVTIEGNFIGTDVSGTVKPSIHFESITNIQTGVIFTGVTNSMIGGANLAARNIISGNNGYGVQIRDAQDGNRVLGNLIGAGADGSALGNGLAENSSGFSGISAGSNSSGIVMIGGTDPLSGNIIAHNWQGVAVGGSTTRVKIRGNSMFENENIGINLGGGDKVIGRVVNKNDLGDADTGGNALQNYPVLGSVQSAGGDTTIRGYLSSTASSGFTVDFYVSPTIHITGYGEGKTWLGSAEVSTDANGHVNFDIVLPVDLAEGNVVTATATDAQGRTSEFSQRQAVGAVMSETFVVTSAGDNDDGYCNTGHCTLREAIRAANNYQGSNIINFDIPGEGVHTISPTFRLPTVIDAVLIDGYTQPGATPNTLAMGSNAVLKIEIEGSQIAQSPINAETEDGLELMNEGSTIRGLVINRIRRGTQNGIAIRVRGSGHRIEGCFIGTDVTGTVALPSFQGIDIYSGTGQNDDSNFIGGTDPAQRNLVSGNIGGIRITSSHNTIAGNLIGPDVSGLNKISGQRYGISIQGEANVLGGSAPGAANVISGNTNNGVGIGGSGQIVMGNLIGTDATGLGPLGNGSDGMSAGGIGHVIGGTGVGEANVISGNERHGISLGTGSKLIQGNFIGVDQTGTGPLGNGGDGISIRISSTRPGSSPDPFNITIGGDAAGAANIIGYNGGAGVVVASDFSGVVVNARQVQISQNSIFSNGGLGIDLDDIGVTPNDPGDLDTGGNDRQNFPEIDSAIIGGSLTTISGSLSSMADTIYRLEFYVNEFADSSGHGEGQLFVGSKDVLTDGAGDAIFAAEFAGELSLQQSVTATAIDPAGNTSEFALSRAVGSIDISADIAVTQTASPDPFIFGEDVTFTATVSNLGPDAAHGVSLTNVLPPDVTVVSALSAQGDCLLLPATVYCTIGSIPSGAHVDVDITINRTVEYSIENTVAVFSNQADPDMDNNTHSLEVGVLKSADLALSKTADPLTVPDGETVTYILSIINNGPSKDFNFELIDVLPAGLTPVSANSDIGACLINDSTVTCSGLIDNLGQTFDVSIVADVSGDGLITNTAGLTSDVLDRKPENDTASVDITIIPTVDLQLSQFDTPDPVAAGETLTYTLNVSSGTGEATGVELVDTLPTGVVFGSAIASQGSCSEDIGVVTCDIGDMAASENATVSIKVTTGAGGVFLTNTATVTALSPEDPDLENNSSSEDTYVSAKCTPTLFGSAHSGDFGPSTLYQVNPQNGEASLVGDIGFERVGAMDFDPVSGTLFAAGERSDFSDIPVLLTIDTDTGAGVELGPMAVSKPVRDLAFRHSDGVLYGYAGSSHIYTFNTTTGAQTLIGAAERGSGNSLTFSPADILYNAGVEMFIIDQVTGSATHIFDLVFSSPANNFPRLPGMDFDPSTGIYYVIVKDGFTGSPETYLGTLDVQTGVVSIIGQTEGSMDGLAVQCQRRGGGIFSDSFEDRGE